MILDIAIDILLIVAAFLGCYLVAFFIHFAWGRRKKNDTLLSQLMRNFPNREKDCRHAAAILTQLQASLPNFAVQITNKDGCRRIEMTGGPFMKQMVYDLDEHDISFPSYHKDGGLDYEYAGWSVRDLSRIQYIVQYVNDPNAIRCSYYNGRAQEKGLPSEET